MSIERFDTYDSVDLADSSYVSPDCPLGVSLAPGETVRWRSNEANQGSVGNHDNGCAAMGLCGLPYSVHGLGGGWQICFAYM
jgi:hypothetical protein|eukprot:COSAG06_NODE_7191_length_2590_cov_5.333581_1_plen_82_part_00